MTLWRLEVARMLRTRRAVALVAVYVLFGLVGPLTARYLEDLISLAGGDLGGATIEFPAPTPADGISQFVSNVVQIGTLVFVVVAAGALAFDAIEEMGVFLRSRVRSMWRILLPRLTVPFAAAAIAFTLGASCAWYETWALIGAPDATAMLLGTVFGVVYLGFATTVVGAVAQWVRGVLATVMGALVVLVALPVVGIVDAIGRWSPSRLATALADLQTGGSPGDYIGPTVTAVVAGAMLVWFAVIGARRREV